MIEAGRVECLACSRFEPPFSGRTTDEILRELGLAEPKQVSLALPLAYTVEVEHYPCLASLVERRRTAALAFDDHVMNLAWLRFEDCARLGLHFELQHGHDSARNGAHPFWSRIYERDRRLRAAGHML